MHMVFIFSMYVYENKNLESPLPFKNRVMPTFFWIVSQERLFGIAVVLGAMITFSRFGCVAGGSGLAQ